MKKAQLKRQTNQHAAVLIPGENVQLIKVATLRDLRVTDIQVEEFRLRCIETAGCYGTPQEAESEIGALENELLLEARSAVVIEAEQSGKVAPIERKKMEQSIWTRTPGGADRSLRKTKR